MFKKSVIAVALMAAAAGSALAQSTVEIYGVMDAGIVSASNVGSANAGITAFNSGVDQTSRLGFRAKEDLGGGHTACVVMEHQVDLGNGSQGLSAGSGSANAVFSRGANVFLEDKSLGKLTLGRQSNAAWGTYQQFDGRNNSNFGSITNFISDGSSFGGTSTAKTGIASLTGTSWFNNAVRYDTPAWNGISGTYARVFGNTAGDLDFGKADQYVLRYDNKGLVFGSVGYYTANSTAGVNNALTKWYGVGVRATKDLTLTANLFQMENPSSTAANTKFDLTSVGARYQINPKWYANAGYYDLKDKVSTASGTKLTSASLNHDLSKRTSLFVGVSKTNSSGTSGISAWGNGGGANYDSLGQSANKLSGQGQDQTAYALGLRHTF
jgi:predicted porin